MRKNKPLSLNKLPTLSVAIPAFNEEACIGRIIKNIMSQQQGNFSLKSVVVYSDGSWDKTHEIVMKLKKKYPILRLRKDGKRIGKYLRLNQAFRECESDILVVVDADIALVGSHFLESLVGEMSSDKNALMVAAHQLLRRPKSLVGKALYAHFLLWDCVRLSLPDQNVAQNFYGSATAFRGSFARRVRIPEKLSDPHLYIYLKAAEKKGFRYTRKAEIRYWPIMTLADIDKLLRRSIGRRDAMLEKMFNIKTEEVYFVPLKYKIIGVLKSFWHEPVYSWFAILLVLYSKYRLQQIEADKSPVWEIVGSTKR